MIIDMTLKKLLFIINFPFLKLLVLHSGIALAEKDANSFRNEETAWLG